MSFGGKNVKKGRVKGGKCKTKKEERGMEKEKSRKKKTSERYKQTYFFVLFCFLFSFCVETKTRQRNYFASIRLISI
jgi:hypothetical protein